MPTFSEPWRCSGRYFDGRSAQRIFAEIATDPFGLIVNTPGEELLWARGLILVEPSAGLDCDRTLRPAGDSLARLRVSAADFARLSHAIGNPGLLLRLCGIRGYLIAAILLLAGMAATFLVILPLVAFDQRQPFGGRGEGGCRAAVRAVRRARKAA